MNIIILAAGQGKRMQSTLPKVLHCLAGKTLLEHVFNVACSLNPSKLIIVIGHEAELIKSKFIAICLNNSFKNLHFVYQNKQLGTGHAVLLATPFLDCTKSTLILYGDVPLIQSQTLLALLDKTGFNNFGILTAKLDEPYGYGRIVRNNKETDKIGAIVKVVEQIDANLAEQKITEINTGIMICPSIQLVTWLNSLSNNNLLGEYYLTDIVSMAVTSGMSIISSEPKFTWEILGINNHAQLASMERLVQAENARKLLAAGVTIFDPMRIDVRGQLYCGRDVTIDVGCIFSGIVNLGDKVSIGPYSVINNCSLASGVKVFAYSYLDGAQIGCDAQIGPYARLRPGTSLGNCASIGNFVEIKNSQIGDNSKINHLSYIGDASIGNEVNIGAGAITCNFDGKKKHRTNIEDRAFIGSGVQLIAPVTVGAMAIVGAGTTLAKDAPKNKLTLARIRQFSLDKKLN